jgi:hypothetical protein
VWTWVALDPDTKLVASWLVGWRDGPDAEVFIADLAPRLRNRIQITTYGHLPYWTIILGRRHLDRTLRTYAEHYNRGRPHRGALALATPLAEARDPNPVSPRDVRRRDLLGGLIHEYHGAAA